MHVFMYEFMYAYTGHIEGTPNRDFSIAVSAFFFIDIVANMLTGYWDPAWYAHVSKATY